MNYWLDLFTGTTWDEFREYGASVSGFRASQRKQIQRLEPGDIFLCYVTGVMRWVGALEFLGASGDDSQIWKKDDFPLRVEVRPLILLEAESGIPMDELEGKVKFFAGPQHAGKFQGFVRRSPNLFKNPHDGELILELLQQAEQHPVSREVDHRKLYPKRLYSASRKKGKRTLETAVSVPEGESDGELEEQPRERDATDRPGTRHTEIQYTLLQLGTEMGFGLWVARNDRGRQFDGQVLGACPSNTVFVTRTTF